MKHITIIAGARPNFMKVAPIINEIIKQKKSGFDIDYTLIHTGQHYDKKMSGNFFKQLNIPHPTLNLNAGGGTQAEQTAAIMLRFEEYLSQNNADLVLVVGDVNSTMACAITAQKMNIKVAHVEAGIRSNDWTMPEEINRLVTDSISNYFFTTSETANKNLLNSGHSKDKIFFVGNTMIDTLYSIVDKCTKPIFNNYILITLHRPSNVDNTLCIDQILNDLKVLSNKYTIVFPIHPRTRKNIIIEDYPYIHFIEPQGYIDFISLIKYSQFVITDSGGIQEETTALHVKCFTLRKNTERPFTLKGSNSLINCIHDIDVTNINSNYDSSIQTLWDGRCSERITNLLVKLLQ